MPCGRTSSPPQHPAWPTAGSRWSGRSCPPLDRDTSNGLRSDRPVGQQMARRVFFSFHFENDYSRAVQVRQIGSLEGNLELPADDWEAMKRKGAVARWIDGQFLGRSCAIVLVG